MGVDLCTSNVSVAVELVKISQNAGELWMFGYGQRNQNEKCV